VVPQDEATKAMEGGSKDPNQLCCTPPAHKGGRVGAFMGDVLAPVLVKKPVAIAVVAVSVAFCALCAWQTSLLALQDTQRNFIPDDSYVAATLGKLDVYFGSNGQSVNLVTMGGDYYASQAGLSISTKVSTLAFVKDTTGESYRSWADAFKSACQTPAVSGVTVDPTTGFVTNEAQYYTGLKAWLSGAGRRWNSDVNWKDPANPAAGIQSSRFIVELEAFNRVVGDRLIVDADKSIEVMDNLRAACKSWTDLPGGTAIPYTYNFLTWETFRIIKQEMLVSTGLCLAAVFFITLALIAHPLTALLVAGVVVMTIIDILGCMNMWGLAIDNVSVINVVIAVGLCVDYAAHVGHNFMKQTGTNAERVVSMMGEVGAAVLCGATSTFLGVMLLAVSKSYVFRVLFQSFFLTVAFGLAHGMVLLPALLSLIGPASYQVGSNKVEEKDVE